jgi:hypothetical protein
LITVAGRPTRAPECCAHSPLWPHKHRRHPADRGVSPADHRARPQTTAESSPFRRPADGSDSGAVRCDLFSLSRRVRPECQGAVARYRHDEEPEIGRRGIKRYLAETAAGGWARSGDGMRHDPGNAAIQDQGRRPVAASPPRHLPGGHRRAHVHAAGDRRVDLRGARQCDHRSCRLAPPPHPRSADRRHHRAGPEQPTGEQHRFGQNLAHDANATHPAERWSSSRRVTGSGGGRHGAGALKPARCPGSGRRRRAVP